MDGTPVTVGASVGSPMQLAGFALVTNGPLAPPERSPDNTCQPSPNLVSFRDIMRYELARRLARAECIISEFGVPSAIVIWLAWLIMAVRRRRLDTGLVIASALVAAVGTRGILLGFLDATSIPSNNMLYLVPVAPMALALMPTVLFGFIDSAKKICVVPP